MKQILKGPYARLQILFTLSLFPLPDFFPYPLLVYYLVAIIIKIISVYWTVPFINKLFTGIALVTGVSFLNQFFSYKSLEFWLLAVWLLTDLKKTEANDQRSFFFAHCLLILWGACLSLLDQGLFMSLRFLFIVILTFASLLSMQLEDSNIFGTFKASIIKAVKVVFLATPIVIILFLFFPRFDLGNDNYKPPQSPLGISDEIDLTNLGEIKLTDAIHYRIRLTYPSQRRYLNNNNLYWVNLILDEVKNLNWKRSGLKRVATTATQKLRPRIHYEVLSELQFYRYLLTLDSPTELPQSPYPAKLVEDKSFYLLTSPNKKLKYKAKSYITKNYPRRNGLNLDNYLSKPRIGKKTQEFLSPLKPKSNEKKIKLLLKKLQNLNLKYSLNPGKFKSIDDFLFRQKTGFCSHFASIFSILARHLDIPSRVVIGYQGGEWNPYENYLILRDRDAHAWSEVFLNNQWQRIDPTALIAPMRIFRGSYQYFDNEKEESFTQKHVPGISNFLKNVSLRLDSFSFKWQMWVQNFNLDWQENLATLLNLNLRSLYFTGLILVILLISLYPLLRHLRLWLSNRKRDPVRYWYKQILKGFASKGMKGTIHQTPKNFYLQHHQKLSKDFQKDLSKFIETYHQKRYGPEAEKISIGQIRDLGRNVIRHLHRYKTP